MQHREIYDMLLIDNQSSVIGDFDQCQGANFGPQDVELFCHRC
jgi:hypothetical protein